ncbi:MAG: hypothetical protein ACM3PE_13400 [Deltaproteobacteria bacterium]
MRKQFCSIILLVFLQMVIVTPAFAANQITLDGSFNDWSGQAYLYDSLNGLFLSDDINYFYWATNEGESNLYFMIQRWSWGSWFDWIPATLYVHLDINANGSYSDTTDRYIRVDYDPSDGSSDVTVYTGKGKYVNSYSGNWGQTSYSGTGNKVEFKASMSDLGMYPAQSIIMYASSSSDSTSSVQWSPIPIMPIWLLITIFGVGLTGALIMFKKRRAVSETS